MATDLKNVEIRCIIPCQRHLDEGEFVMKHAIHLTRHRPCRADNCITLPVTPEGIRSADLKEALGWEPQATDRVGVIILCK